MKNKMDDMIPAKCNYHYCEYESLPLALTIPQVAEVLHVSKNTAYGMVRSGQLHSVRVGNQIRISRDALKAFLSN